MENKSNKKIKKTVKKENVKRIEKKQIEKDEDVIKEVKVPANKRFFKYTKDRSFVTNIAFCIFCLFGVLLIPSIIAAIANRFFDDTMMCSFIGNLVFLFILVFMYFKDLNDEFNIFTKSFKNNFVKGFKIYILGFMGMVFFNVIIMLLLKDVSANENQVREMLFSSPIFTFLCISLTAPFCEEIVFRKSLQPVVKNKLLYCLLCGVLFGFAHIMTNVINGAFAITDLIYILPYGSLGAAFALMDYDTKTTFTSIMMHALHNSLTGILLLVTYYGGYIK